MCCHAVLHLDPDVNTVGIPQIFAKQRHVRGYSVAGRRFNKRINDFARHNNGGTPFIHTAMWNVLRPTNTGAVNEVNGEWARTQYVIRSHRSRSSGNHPYSGAEGKVAIIITHIHIYIYIDVPIVCTQKILRRGHYIQQATNEIGQSVARIVTNRYYFLLHRHPCDIIVQRPCKRYNRRRVYIFIYGNKRAGRCASLLLPRLTGVGTKTIVCV